MELRPNIKQPSFIRFGLKKKELIEHVYISKKKSLDMPKTAWDIMT